MRISLYLKKNKDYILDLLFPIKCVNCNKKSEILCRNCVSQIRLAERETDTDIYAVFDYRDQAIKKAIWELKYYNKRYLGHKLGELLYEYLIEDMGALKTYVAGRSILVVPVPISKNKTKKRGYNQAFAIAKGFCNQSNSKILELKNNIVFKKVDTLPQARIMNRKARLKNIKGVFDIKNKTEIKGRTIIVIDDVTTTGGTINEIIRILTKGGAKKVVGFAVAH